MPTTHRLAKSAFWNSLGIVAGRSLAIPVGMILGRLMGRQLYGELGIILVSIELFGTFAGVGLGMTATKHIAEFREKDFEKTSRIIGLATILTIVFGVVLAVLLFSLSLKIAVSFLAAPHLAYALRISAVLLLLNVIDGTQAGSLAGFEAFRTLARLRLLKGILEAPCMILGYFVDGLPGVLWGLVLARLISCGVMQFALSRHATEQGTPVVFQGVWQEFPIVRQFSLPAFASGALVGPVNWVCAAFLVNQPHGYVEMGAYSAANQWFNFIAFIPVAVGAGTLPILSERLANRDIKSSREVLRLILMVTVIVALPVCLILSALSEPIMALYGRNYEDSWSTLVVILWTGAIFATLTPVGQVLAASGRMWIACGMNLAWAVIYIGMSLLFVHWGALGLASARLVAYILHSAWTCAFAFRLLAANPPSSEVPIEQNESSMTNLPT
jgi:O-antigen/teichoic acid export membrane protein